MFSEHIKVLLRATRGTTAGRWLIEIKLMHLQRIKDLFSIFKGITFFYRIGSTFNEHYQLLYDYLLFHRLPMASRNLSRTQRQKGCTACISAE